jgi:hypothetical protein
MNFIEAFKLIEEGQTLTRRKWQGKAKVYIVRNKLNNINHVEVRTTGNCIMYAASSEDLLGMDWELVNPEIQPKKTKHEQVPEEEIVL